MEDNCKEKDEKILNADLWEMHLTRQFNWTSKLRQMIYDKVNIKDQKRILDAGCGIGLISREISGITGAEVYGIDINESLIEKARANFPGGCFKPAAIENIPYEDNFFDVTICNFVLMWIKNPVKALSELIRTTKPGGWIVCSGEPDYGGKIDFPDEYNASAATVRALQREGANPFMGRRLKSVFSACKLKPEMGVFADLWSDETLWNEYEHVWKFANMTAKDQMTKDWVKVVQKSDRDALERGELITFLPIFWAIARKG